MKTSGRFTSIRPMPPMMSPSRFSPTSSITVLVSPGSSNRTVLHSPTSPTNLQIYSAKQPAANVQQTTESDSDMRMQRLAKVVAGIYQRQQEPAVHDQPDSNRFQPVHGTKKVFEDLFLRNNKNFGTYREPVEDHSKNNRHIPNSRRNKLLSDDRDEAMTRKVDFELIKFEENRKISVEKCVLERKERLTRLIENLRAASIAKLEDRLNSMNIEEDKFNKSLACEDDDENAELRLRQEQKRLEQDHEKREREREARLLAATHAAAREQAKQEEVQRLEVEREEHEKQLRLEEKEREQNLEDLKDAYNHFETVLMKTRDVLDQSYVQQVLQSQGVDLNVVNDAFDGAHFSRDVIQSICEAASIIESQLEQIEEQRQRYEQEKERREQEEKAEREQSEKDASEHQQEEKANLVISSVDNVSDCNLQRYQQLVKYKHDHLQATQSLVHDKEMKTFVFGCMKAVNTPVNAIGRSNASHLMDKINKLQSLLRGQTVEVQENQFSAAAHPLGIAYCKGLLAAKLVKQGEEVVRAQPKDAFTVAAVVVSLWSEFPDFGDLFLANLFETCPFLIPCHFAQKEGMSDEDYYKRLGYNYDAQNKVEDQVTFEGRMGGVGRLYAAVMVSTLPKESLRLKKDHPHGLGNAWRWLASTLNMKPVNGVTTTLLVNMLEVCGNELFTKYKNNFRSLIQSLAQDYFPLLGVTSLEASKNRLQTLLEKIINTGGLKHPDGFMNPGFL